MILSFSDDTLAVVLATGVARRHDKTEGSDKFGKTLTIDPLVRTGLLFGNTVRRHSGKTKDVRKKTYRGSYKALGTRLKEERNNVINEQGDGTGGPSCSRKKVSDIGRGTIGRPQGTKV